MAINDQMSPSRLGAREDSAYGQSRQGGRPISRYSSAHRYGSKALENAAPKYQSERAQKEKLLLPVDM